MMDLNKKYGPFSARVWGLIINFIANILLLYGVTGFIQKQERLGIFIAGLVLTVTCIAILSIPNTDSN